MAHFWEIDFPFNVHGMQKYTPLAIAPEDTPI